MATGDKRPVVMEFDRAVPNGVATLDADGLLPEEQLPLQEITPGEVDEDWDAVMAEEDAAVTQAATGTAPRKLSAAVTAALTELKELKKYLGRAGFRQAVRRIKGELSSKADKNAVAAELADLKKRPYSNSNLFDNWYFVGGGSQQGGGQFPINQRGQTEYPLLTTGDYAYFIDRWLYGKGVVPAIGPDGITITYKVNSHAFIFQRLSSDLLSVLRGKTVTMSVLAKGSGNISLGTANNMTISQQALDDEYTVFQHCFTWPTNQDVWTDCPSVALTEGSIVTVAAMKLELGPIQTLAHKEGDNWVFNDPPPNYQQELAKCQRYYYQTNHGYSYLSGTAFCISGASGANIFLPVPVPLRANPTLIVNIANTEGPSANIWNDNEPTTYRRITEISLPQYNGTHVMLAAITDKDMNIGETYRYQIAAPNYIGLSADL